jgi:hypothetical protein
MQSRFRTHALVGKEPASAFCRQDQLFNVFKSDSFFISKV